MIQIFCNGEQRLVSPSTTVSTLLEELGVQLGYVAVEVNEQLVPRKQHDECELFEGDRLEVVTLVGGG